MRNFEYTKILGWSVSRYDTFSTCRRQYYYQYYGKFDREYTQLEINVLKNLTTLPLEIGNVTHGVFATLLNRIKKTSEAIDEERFFEFARNAAREKTARKEFAETYYGDLRKIDVETDVIPRVELSLANFLASERFKWLFNEAASSKDRWIVEPPGFGECRIDGLKVYCKVDFLFPVADKLVILDWKTGKPTVPRAGEALDKHAQQLRGYMIWTHFQFDQDYAKIQPIVAYLVPEYSEREVALSEFDIGEFSTIIRTQTDEMYAFCEDVEENIPKPKYEFEMTTNSSACRYCNFRELCGKA